MNNTITASEFLNTKCKEISDSEKVYGLLTYEYIEEIMIEFTKIHVKNTLIEVLDNIPCLGSSTDIPSYEEVKDAILTAYPLENIK